MAESGSNWAEELLHQEYYRPDELAELLNMREDFINHQVATRKLRARKFGDDTIDIPRDAVLEWLRDRELSDEERSPF